MSKHQVPHYKTLDIVKFYNQVYDFVSRYLIFVLAGIFAIITILIIWIWEPDTSTTTKHQVSSGSIAQGYVQETGLIYPVNYFAEGSLNFEGDNKILGLGGPIWRNQGMWNSIDNIVQYNGVILPRQISRSAWVPKLQQEFYSESMIKTFLEGMGTSQADSSSIMLAMDSITKKGLSGSMVDRFGIGCSIRPIMTTTFCDLKLIDAINQWGSYDLSSATTQLPMVYDYIFVSHPNTDIQKLRCQAMIQQYRYSANPLIKKLTQGCSSTITTEAEYISNMVAVNEEVRSNKFNNKIYSEPSINRYKLMSWYQYFIPKITTDQFNDEDVTILTNYDSYITKLVSRGSIAQPYGDIISVFHQQYLIPWLDRRDSFAKPNEKALTQALKKTTDLIIYGDTSQGMVSITSGSRIKPIDFLMSQGLYYGDNDATTSGSSSINNQISTSEPQSSSPATTTQVTGSVTTQQQDTTTSGDSSLDALISQVLGTTPTATPIKRGQIILIKYNYKGVGWIAAVDLGKKGATQLYYDSLISGATKITHPKVIFNTSNKELIIAIMNNHISTNPQ